jgi:hypothetical protein
LTGVRHAWQSHGIDTLVRVALPAASAQEVEEGMTWIEIGAELLKLREASRINAGLRPLNARAVIDGLLRDLGNLEPRSWHARLVAAQAALRRNEETSENQMMLGVRAMVVELASLLRQVHVVKK